MEKFIEKTLSLLKEEREAELLQANELYESSSLTELEKKGICLLKLKISSHHTGLYSHICVSFEHSFKRDFSSHHITNGDVVGISLASEPITKHKCQGIVSQVHKNSLNVAFELSCFDLIDFEDNSAYNILKLSNDVTYQRITKCLQRLPCSPQLHLKRVLFEKSDLYIPFDQLKYPKGDNISFFNEKLNDTQKEAVEFVLKQKDIAIIHGPPGTGKTTTVVETILQSIKMKQKILACAPSNIAVDNIVEKLAAYKTKVLRLGHPARAMNSLSKYTLDAILSSSSNSEIIRSVRDDIDSNLKKLKRKKGTESYHQIKNELKILRKELREREKSAMKQILAEADVIVSTLTSASPDGPLQSLKESHFDLVVIDECSQAIEAACWIVLPYASKCLLAGDHYQLPPTIISEKAAKNGLALSLMERIIKLYEKSPGKIIKMLDIQYRMNDSIMLWSSQNFYDGDLKADKSVESHLLSDLESVIQDDNTISPFVMIDTAGCNFYELNLIDEMSKANEGEADLVALHVEQLLQSGLDQNDIGIISPYNLQVQFIRLRLQEKYPKLEIKSVDSFQGREKEAIVISLVRSNQEREIGFLAEKRRLNVAITRARRHLALICDSETISSDKYLQSLVHYVMDHCEVRSASMFEEEINKMSSIRPVDLKFKEELREKKSVKVVKNKILSHKKTEIIKMKKNKEKEADMLNRDEDKERRDKMESLVEEFVSDTNSSTLELTPDMTSYERMLIHELCEKMHLNHVSIGEGNERYLVISKVDVKINSLLTSSSSKPHEVMEKRGITENYSKPELDPPVLSLKDKTKQSSKPHKVMEKRGTPENYSKPKLDPPVLSLKDNEIRCKQCKSIIPKENFTLHQLHCDKIIPANVQKNKLLTKSLGAQISAVDDEDFDLLISTVKKSESICSYFKCKVCVLTLGQKCCHCSKYFCIKHLMAEIHGCGLAAKTEARLKMRKDAATAVHSNSLSKSSKASSRIHLENKMKKKKKEMSDKRQAKKK